LPNCRRNMPKVSLTAGSLSCIGAVCREYYRAKDNNCQRCFHDDAIL
jgi:hypothetical protein